MKNLFFVLLLIFTSVTAFCQPLETNNISYRIINIGNTVDIKNIDGYANGLKNLISSFEEPVLLVLNGDLIKKNKSRYLGSDSLQVFNLLKTLSNLKNTKIIVLPGDRDWNNSKKNGLKKVKKLEKLVENDQFKNVMWILDNGCPGPELIEIDSNLLLLTINTQWWNHPYKKPSSVEGDCDIITKKDFVIEFENALSESDEKNLIIAGHFPLVEQASPSFKDYIFPFPIVGSFTSSFHQNIGGTEDIVNERFNSIRKTLLKRMSVKNGLIYLSGHNNNTQIIKKNENYFINNGLPEGTSNTTKIKGAYYSSTKPGITELVYYKNGDVTSEIYNYVDDYFQKESTIPLYKSILDSSQSKRNIPINYSSKNSLKDVSSATSKTNKNQFVTTKGGEYNASKFKNIVIGKHYRSSWNALIKVPVLNMDTTKRGLIPYDRGGGHQTTSLKMYGKDGYAYTFRSVNKDATRDLSIELKNSIIARQLQDNVSMQHPYGGLIVSKLLDYTSILHARPELYVLPTNNKLSAFRNYQGLLGTLEDHQKNPKKVKNAFANADKLLQSHQLNQQVYENHHHKIDAKEYTKARVFDMLIGDYGKHQDNWKWAGYKSDTGTTYRPIPRDRDLVFAKWDGIIPWIADRKWALESGEHFGYKINDVKSLMFVARHPDRFLTNEMNKQDWINASQYIQSKLTDEVITAAAKTIPQEIYHLSGRQIEDKLKVRIKDLDKYALRYYKLLAKQVDVVGSNKKEYFDVIRNDDGSVDVFIWTVKKEAKSKKKLYHRKFVPQDTKEIRLYGLGGKDVFKVAGDVRRSIPIIIVGGHGGDIITDESNVKTWGKQTKVYENSKHRELNLGKEAKSINTWNKELYDFQPSVFEYNRYLPLFSLNFNEDNGFGTGIGVVLTRKEKFGNVNFSSKHRFSADISTEGNRIFKYKGRFHHLIKKWDFQIGGLVADHNSFTNFFGIGNNTVRNDSLDDINFYRTTYNTYSINTGVIKDFWKKSSFSLNVEFQHNAAQLDKNTIAFSDPENNSSLIFGTADNNIIISSAQLNIDFRDRKNLPEKGIRLYGKYRNGIVTNNGGSSYDVIEGFLEHYFTVYIPSPITLGLKGGGSISNGEIPFYNLNYLGNGNNLRGFKNNRFTGKSTAFINTDLRIQLINFTSSFVPMKIGVKVFFDSGRIFSDFDITNKWHNGYGAGFYWVLLNEQFTFNISYARSEEEDRLILFSLGKTFN